MTNDEYNLLFHKTQANRSAFKRLMDCDAEVIKMIEAAVESKSKRLQEREWVPLTVEEPYNGWVLRNVYFEDGEPLMHSEPESTQSQELFGRTEELEAEIKRLQELADYRLKLLTKMPSEWVGLTDEDMEGMFLNAEGIRIARYIEVRLKEKNT